MTIPHRMATHRSYASRAWLVVISRQLRPNSAGVRARSAMGRNRTFELQPEPVFPHIGLARIPSRRRWMPAKSGSQQKAAGAALSAKRGDTPKSKLKGASKSMMSMSEKELEKMAHTKRKGKPEHVKH